MPNKKIGVIVHGPGIIDSGYAKKIINILRNYGDVTARLGGTMGRTAVIDANLENEINIKDKLLPSQSVKLLSKNNDILFLLNYGKSIVTGHTFGYKVFHRSGNVKLIQIERPGESDGTIIPWNTNDPIINSLSDKLKLTITKQNDVEKFVKNQTGYENVDILIKRKIAGVSPGENIMVNGTVIGQATSSNLTIISKDNNIIDLNGGTIKGHGIEKLGQVDIKKAIVKTGLLRKNDQIKPRIIEHTKNSTLKAVYLDHAGEDIYKYSTSDILVSVGDDTTLLSSDILYRFNVPIIGITDGDLDKVVEKGFKSKDSIIIQVQSGYDDIIGHLIYEKIFDYKSIITIDNLKKFKDQIITVIKESDVDYEIVEKQLN